MTAIYVVVADDGNGNEGLCGVQIGSNMYPLVGLENQNAKKRLLKFGQTVANATKQPCTLKRLSSSEIVQEITPQEYVEEQPIPVMP